MNVVCSQHIILHYSVLLALTYRRPHNWMEILILCKFLVFFCFCCLFVCLKPIYRKRSMHNTNGLFFACVIIFVRCCVMRYAISTKIYFEFLKYIYFAKNNCDTLWKSEGSKKVPFSRIDALQLKRTCYVNIEHLNNINTSTFDIVVIVLKWRSPVFFVFILSVCWKSQFSCRYICIVLH